MAVRAALLPVAVLLLSTESDAADGYGVAGPFKVFPDHYDACPPSERLDVPFWIDLKYKRLRNMPTYMNIFANITTSVTIDDSFGGLVKIDSWSARGGWKPNAFRFEVPHVCSFFKNNLPGYYRRLLISTFGDTNHSCPLPPGNYVVRSFTSGLDWKKSYMPVFFYGKFRTTGILIGTASRKRVACARASGRSVPTYVQQR